MMQIVTSGEPPSGKAPAARTSIFMIGRDSRGRWVVQDREGLHGGLFIGRVEVLRFALFENGNQPQAVVMVPGVFELDMRGRPRDTASGAMSHAGPYLRAA